MKFIHIINIAITIYNDCTDKQILMSLLRALNQCPKKKTNAPVSSIESLDDVRIHR